MAMSLGLSGDFVCSLFNFIYIPVSSSPAAICGQDATLEASSEAGVLYVPPSC